MKAPFLLLATIAALVSGCTKETRTIPTGLRGEARSNPLLAAQRTLDRLGVPTSIQYGLTTLPEQGDVLLTEEGSLAVEGEILDGFIAWVEGGGQAVVCLDGFDLRTGLDELVMSEEFEEFEEQFGLFSETTMPWYHRESALLDCLEVERYPVDEADLDTLGFEVEARTADGHLKHDIDSGLLVQVDRGAGSVTVIPSGHFFNNENLGEAEHAALLFQLVDEACQEAPSVEPRLLIAYADAPGLWSLLSERAPYALVAALVLLLLWLWRAWPRFGPVEDFDSSARPGFKSHAASIGQFLWSHDRGPTLLGVARRRAIARWRAAIPGSDTMGKEELCRAIASKTPYGSPEIERALFGPGPFAPDAFVAAQRTLTQLSKRN